MLESMPEIGNRPESAMGWLDRNLLFHFDGRISRAAYWRAALVWTVLLVALYFILFLLGLITPYLAICVGLIALLLMLTSNVAVSRKRLHDRGKSGWWLLLFFVGPIILQAAGTVAVFHGQSLGGSFETVCAIASFAIFVWMIVELGCLAGTVGPNRYGPDPL
jgi:uncharacterized membrane protein YhaH (DUF805 family)